MDSKLLRALLTDVVDYAGLFPPAELPMETAVANYASYRSSRDRWMLGGLVLPVSRLDEFEAAAAPHLPRDEDDPGWRLIVLCAADMEAACDRMVRFDDQHARPDAGLARIAAMECRVETPEQMVELTRTMHGRWDLYFEIPIVEEPGPWLDTIAELGQRAKMRTGGVFEHLFPTSDDLARFLVRCDDKKVPFKATAGLHHPIRARHALRYSHDSPRGMMFGFLNVFLAAAFLHAHSIDAALVEKVLLEERLQAFRFEEHLAAWGDLHVSLEQIEATRREFALSFGSCSFEEPLEDLQKVGLL